MKYAFRNTVVVALGGSIVHPDGIDVRFLKDFKKFIAPFLKKGMKFVFVIGGGTLSRRFQEAAEKVAKVADEDKDWIGIHATRLNAHLVRTIFREVADPVIIDIRGKIARPEHPVTVAAGWRPGWSTDYVAMRIAADFGADEAVIAGKPAYVYDRDPGKYPNAKRFDEIGWAAYRKLIPAKWKPGLHAPVDPVGAKLGASERVKAIIIDGRNMKNFAALLNGKEFKGTIIG
ncbi:MAG: UMP kinase [Candidatus Pacebacteria bacterium]|nr:UMP kinase [Candidatus Paceibacterota bacterium]